MSRRIRILPDVVANQIAAGEVVERPASVVKELVENALDAGSTRVEVSLERGGKGSIRVADDGTGMGREDALLSLDRHATSKIGSAEDLRAIRSFGFRGEALPSIAAVSRFRMETREQAEEVGTVLRVEGGQIVSVEDGARQPGTTMEVRNLFFNAPARSRFLRSVTVESRGVSDVVVALALANPGVAFTLTSDGRVLLDLPAARDPLERIGALWGDDAAGQLLPIRGESGGVHLRGLVQRPDRVRPGFRRAHLFLRGRPIRDGALLRAVDRAYRTTVPEGHRPWLFLYLDLPDGEMDVNVHPAKAEVRFRDLRAVEGVVEGVVREGLRGEASAAVLGSPSLPPPSGRGASSPSGAPVRPRPSPSGVQAQAVQTALFLSRLPEDPGLRSGPSPAAPEPMGGEQSADTPEGTPEGGAAGDRLWQVLDRYILAETRDGLLLIDQHAAHERVLFERIMQALDEGGAEAQQLLFPLTLRLTPAECQVVESMRGLFARTGFQVEGFGEGTVVVQAVPSPHPYFDAEAVLREMVEELAQGSPLLRAARNQRERMAMSFACKAAVKAGQPLSQVEIRELFDALFATELPYHDVHGRPTTVRLTRAELERKFGR